MSDELRVHRMQRKLVMQYLLAKGFVPVDPLRLLYHLRDLRYACTRATLNFHLSYLAEANWISVEWKKEVIGEEREILSVKISRPGVDALDAGELDVAIASA